MINKLKNIKITKNEIIMIVLIFIIIIIGLYNGTFAFFSTQKDTKISVSSKDTFGNTKVIKSNVILEGELSHTTNKTQGLNTSNTISIQLEDVTDYDYLVTLATQIDPHNTNFLEEVGSSIKYEVYHKTDTSIDTSTLFCESNSDTSCEIEDYCQTGTFENKLDGTPFDIMTDYKIKDTNTHYFDVYIYLSNENIGTSKLKTSFFFLTTPTNKLKTLEEVKTFISNNEPDLNTGLIPVVYDEENKTENGTGWFVADTTKVWYDYEEQWWANAVSVDSSTIEKRQKYVNTDGTYKIGTEIATADMLAMFVWIPRYSYTIGCTSSTSCYGYKIDGASDLAKSTPGAIDIKFVDKDTTENYTGDSPTYTYTSEVDRNPTNYYTHPAFTFGGDELSGIWVGKFETSVNPSSTCYNNLINENGSTFTNCQASNEDVTPRILPNVLSLVDQNIYNQFNTAKKFASNTMYGLTNKTDSLMMKNSEWAAVTYLSQSIYGKYGNPNYEGTNKEIYKNDSGASWPRYTGRSQGVAPATSSYSDEGTYKYDDISTTDGTKVANSGTGASTTGNIYGIYDMFGGAYEYVMGYYTEASSVFGGYTSSSGTESNYSGFTNETKPDAKYFDGYKGTIEGETKSIDLFTRAPEVIGHATAETKNWYSDIASSISASLPWVMRGGYFFDSSNAGAFDSYGNDGFRSAYYSFRSVLATIE